jgi:hypothetical protein
MAMFSYSHVTEPAEKRTVGGKKMIGTGLDKAHLAN